MESVFKKLRNIAEKTIFSEKWLKGRERTMLLAGAIYAGGALLIFVFAFIIEPFVFPLPAPVIPLSILGVIAFLLSGISRLFRLGMRKRK